MVRRPTGSPRSRRGWTSSTSCTSSTLVRRTRSRTEGRALGVGLLLVSELVLVLRLRRERLSEGLLAGRSN
jgi:hypothetical protein